MALSFACVILFHVASQIFWAYHVALEVVGIPLAIFLTSGRGFGKSDFGPSEGAGKPGGGFGSSAVNGFGSQGGFGARKDDFDDDNNNASSGGFGARKGGFGSRNDDNSGSGFGSRGRGGFGSRGGKVFIPLPPGISFLNQD